MQVAKWGNSLAIRIPASVVKVLGLAEGDDVSVRVLGERDLAVERTPSRAAMLARLDAFEGRMPPDFAWDRDDAHRG